MPLEGSSSSSSRRTAQAIATNAESWPMPDLQIRTCILTGSEVIPIHIEAWETIHRGMPKLSLAFEASVLSRNQLCCIPNTEHSSGSRRGPKDSLILATSSVPLLVSGFNDTKGCLLTSTKQKEAGCWGRKSQIILAGEIKGWKFYIWIKNCNNKSLRQCDGLLDRKTREVLGIDPKVRHEFNKMEFQISWEKVSNSIECCSHCVVSLEKKLIWTHISYLTSK